MCERRRAFGRLRRRRHNNDDDDDDDDGDKVKNSETGQDLSC
jgi:hypothetical protein